LVFVGAPLGLVLAGLYSIARPVPWYGLMIISTSVCSVASLLAIAYVRRDQLRERGQIAVMVLLVVFLPVLLLRPTFTVAGIVVCMTGIIMVATAIRSRTHAKMLIWFGSICVGLGAVVRFDSFVGVVAVFTPFIILILCHLGWRRSVLAVIIVSAVIATSSLTDRSLNSSPAWSSYLDFNEALGPLIANSDFDRAMKDLTDPDVSKVLTNIGWNADDVALLNNWFFYDPTVYSPDHLSELGALTGRARYNAPLSDSARLVLSSHRQLWTLVVALGFAVLASRRRQVWLVVLIQLTWCVVVFSVTAASHRFPERVSIPMYMALGIVLTLGMPLVLNERMAGGARSPQRGPWPRIALVACLSVGFEGLSTEYTPWEISQRNRVTIAEYQEQRQDLRLIDPSGRFLCLGAALTIEGTDALAASGYHSNRILCTGWPMPGPSFVQRRAALGITPTMLDTLATDRHVFLVLGPSAVSVFERLYLRYLGLNVTLDEVGHLSNGAIVVQVREVTDPTGP
jgi:hypothetical protein